MADGGHELPSAPGAHDGLLDFRVARDVDHGPEATGNQDRVVIRGIHLGQLATAVQPAKRLAPEEPFAADEQDMLGHGDPVTPTTSRISEEEPTPNRE